MHQFLHRRYQALFYVAPYFFLLGTSLSARYPGLSVFLTPDEFLWLDRSRNFLLALQNQDWLATLQTGHPGVTTMWTGAAGLYFYGLQHELIQNSDFTLFLQSIAWDNIPVPLLSYVRLATVLLTTATILIVYTLVTTLFDRWVALVVALFLALDPWYLAHSRVLHHDALISSFMLLSVLSIIVYFWRYSSPWLLVFSGICAGLALLSKMLALYLIPWSLLVFVLAYMQHRQSIRQLVVKVIFWNTSAMLTIFVLWPAMWLSPSSTIGRVYQTLITYSINPNEKGQFFLGQPIADPGMLYYPVVISLAITPLVLIGIFSTIGLIVGYFRKQKVELSSSVALAIIYVIGYIAFISLGDKKHERYILPALLMLNVIGGIGIATIGQLIVQQLRQHRQTHLFDTSLTKHPSTIFSLLGIMIVLIFQSTHLLAHYPYYFTYSNPLLGGPKTAAATMLVGWGEGIDLAAEYLNQLPDHETINVVSSMPDALALHFQGNIVRWFPVAKVFEADYFVLYRREWQQGYPSRELIDYITASWPLEQTISLHGVPYVWIYRAPAADWSQSFDEDDSMVGFMGLLSYKTMRDTSLNGSLALTLYRQYFSFTNESWFVRLANTEFASNLIRLRSSQDNNLKPGEIAEQVIQFHDIGSSPIEPLSLQIGLQEQNDSSITWHTVTEGLR